MKKSFQEPLFFNKRPLISYKRLLIAFQEPAITSHKRVVTSWEDDLRDGTLDLRLTFDNGHALEIIPDSSGYEARTLQRVDQQFIAVGGGDLAVYNDDKQDRA